MSSYRCMLRPTWMFMDRMISHEQMKCTATLLLYITLESAVSWTNSSCFYYLNFMKFTFLGFHVVVLNSEDLSIDVWITNVWLILMKLRWFQLCVTSQNLNFKLFWKNNQNFWFPWCSTRWDLSIDVSVTNVGLILTKIWWFLFSGYGRIDTVLESSHGNMSAHKKFQLKAQN